MLTINPLRPVQPGLRTYTGKPIDAATAARWNAITQRLEGTTGELRKTLLAARRRALGS